MVPPSARGVLENTDGYSEHPSTRRRAVSSGVERQEAGGPSMPDRVTL